MVHAIGVEMIFPNVKIIIIIVIIGEMLKIWANSGLFFFYFWSFQTNITSFTAIYVKISIEYPVLGYKPTTSWL